MSEIQDKIQSAVERLGGIDELAKIVGVNFTTAWRWFDGRTKPSPLVMRILKAQRLI